MHPWRRVKREEDKEDVAKAKEAEETSWWIGGAEAKEAEETSSWIGGQVDALLSHWHSLWNVPEQQGQRQVGTEQPRVVPHNNKKKLSLSTLHEKSASLLISTSAPTPNPPCFSCDTQFSFSGFHHGKRKRKKVPYRET
jgi:hypothetical protein